MKKILFAIVALLLCNAGWAQKALTAKEAASVETEIKAAAAKVNTIESNFSQVKHVGGMTRDLSSTGIFRYKKNNRVRFDYTLPFKYQLVVNGNKVKMSSNGKSKVYNASANPAMSEAASMLSACMTGDLQTLKTKYNLAYYQSNNEYEIRVTPKTANAMMQSITLHMRKTDKMLTRMRIMEKTKPGKKESDYTEYKFTNEKQNSALADALFAIN
jgi:outer membrane lipoprotein-sorting protein